MVVKLRDRIGMVAATVFLAPGGDATVDGLPSGAYRPDFAMGELWSRACNMLRRRHARAALPRLHRPSALGTLVIPPDLPGQPPPVDISDQEFAAMTERPGGPAWPVTLQESLARQCSTRRSTSPWRARPMRQEGVDVRFASAPSPGRPRSACWTARADVCWGGPMRVMQAYAQAPDCDLVHFAEVVTRDPFLLLGRTPRPDFALRDLPGLRVATVSEVPTPWMCLQEDLRRAGVAPARLNRVSDRTMADNVAALRRGELDVVQVFEPFAAALEAEGAGHVWYAAARRGPTSYTTFYTRRAMLRDRREELHGMVRAIHRTLKLVARADGAAIADAIAGFFPGRPPALLAAACAPLQGAGHLGNTTRSCRAPVTTACCRDWSPAGSSRRGTPFEVAVDNSLRRGGRGRSAAARLKFLGGRPPCHTPPPTTECACTTRRPAPARPVIFVHEYAGDHRSWEPQMRHFGQRYRAIAYAARGYPPSDVPDDVAKYSQVRAADDIGAVLDHLRIDKAHVVGLSMGGFATLHFGFRHAARARSLVVAGCGYGAEPDQRDALPRRGRGDRRVHRHPGHGGVRREIRLRPDPRAVREQGPARLRRVQARSLASILRWARATRSWACSGSGRRCTSWWSQMQALTVPTLILTGDEDWPCLAPGLLMKQHIPTAALAVMPNCGHAINIEDPDEFNRLVGAFLAQVDARPLARRATRVRSRRRSPG